MHDQLFFSLGKEVDKWPFKVSLTNGIPNTSLTPFFSRQNNRNAVGIGPNWWVLWRPRIKSLVNISALHYSLVLLHSYRYKYFHIFDQTICVNRNLTQTDFEMQNKHVPSTRSLKLDLLNEFPKSVFRCSSLEMLKCWTSISFHCDRRQLWTEGTAGSN